MKNSSEHEKFMRMAIRLSEQNIKKGLGGPFGAVIVKEGKVIAKSANKVTTLFDPTAHAEVSAIRLASKRLRSFDLSGCVIYTSCEPCPMCLGAIYWAKIDKIYYGNSREDASETGFDDKFIYDELHLSKARRTLPIVQILREEALNAFDKWNKSPLKIDY